MVDIMATHSEEINDTLLKSHDLSPITEQPNYEIVSVNEECTVRFACEWTNNRIAHILLLLINDTPSLIEWKLHCTTAAIIAFPSGNGQISSYCEEKCMLSWICPNYIETWQQMEPAELLFSLKLFANNDNFIGSAHIKLLAQLDRNEFCTAENPPIHNLIFGSNEATLNRIESQLSLPTALEVTEIISPVINFALNRFHENIACVQIKFVNNSKRQIVWKLKTNNKCITALPSGNGLVPALKNVKCILSWQLPKHCQSWDKVKSAKLLISIRIYTETGKLLAEDIAKYIVKPNVSHICTLDNIPTHQIVLISSNVSRSCDVKSKVRTLTSTEK
ncbi:unnamed protein product [Cercopithifilaria johnstoni]|uniref:Uncharacterized protein n=1 Tax=Cercopithifilaria johnstoni TaxID=2874296 RepID=A0A8J2MP74_9BILA|nr:unnamed protein product [Cercopithifilaria johnstoni]